MFFHFFTETRNGCLKAVGVKSPCKAIFLRGAQTFVPFKKVNEGGGTSPQGLADTGPNTGHGKESAPLRWKPKHFHQNLPQKALGSEWGFSSGANL